MDDANPQAGSAARRKRNGSRAVREVARLHGPRRRHDRLPSLPQTLRDSHVTVSRVHLNDLSERSRNPTTVTLSSCKSEREQSALGEFMLLDSGSKIAH